MKILLAALAIIAMLGFGSVKAEAHAESHTHSYSHHHHHRHHHHHHWRSHGRRYHLVYDRGEVVAHPAGCNWREYCGCGASVEAFGHSVRSLWLAANWLQFPSASPAPGMAAVRRHHVFIIRAVFGDGTVMAYDANSGGHLTRIHRRSLAGFRVVNPHSSRYAMG